MTRSSIWLAVLLAAGCNSGPPDNAEDLDPPPAGQGIQYRMQSTIAAGFETEKCQLFVAPPEGLMINRETVRYTPGSHHVLLFLTSYTSIPATTRHGMPVDPNGVNPCPDGASADYDITTVVAGAQSADAPDIVKLPPDVALKVPGGSVLVMNTHYLNATSQELVTDARINLYTIPASDVKHEAGIIFFYDPIIKVPALGKAQARMACPVNRPYTILNLQTHMHKRGIGGEAMVTDSAGNPVMPIYSSSTWENPEVTEFDPGMQVQAGQLIDYRCHYDNTEDRTVFQGATTKDEMCMLIGAYYPRNTPFEYCSPDGTSDNSAFAATFIGGGTKTCTESVKCIEDARLQKGSAEKYYDCILDSCEKAARPFNDYLRCILTKADSDCKTQCQDQTSPDCASCVKSSCATQETACAATSC